MRHQGWGLGFRLAEYIQARTHPRTHTHAYTHVPLLWHLCAGTGKYSADESVPQGPRGVLFRQLLPKIQPVLEVLRAIATARSKTMSQVCAGSEGCRPGCGGRGAHTCQAHLTLHASHQLTYTPPCLSNTSKHTSVHKCTKMVDKNAMRTSHAPHPVCCSRTSSHRQKCYTLAAPAHPCTPLHTPAHPTCTQVAINWAMCRGAVPIPGAKDLVQARDNLGALGWRLSEGEVRELEAAAARMDGAMVQNIFQTK